MADINPSLPGGAVPPKPGEAPKVQPKKETVRINLPPKPSAAPTIKLPTLPPGGPSAGAPVTMAPPTAPAAKPASAAPTHAGAAPVAVGAKPMQQRPPPPPARPAIGALDTGLAIGAAIAGLVAIGTTIYCLMLFT
ncbi:MAG TPA: hypothetical protein VG754_11585 [Verrucomicrobiae bacterium]|jgi:hypothetical protein|nr:hypothetical protein [Verrucomicrobiae bacterium]